MHFILIISCSIPTHIAYLILDQKSFSQALQTFKWASKLPNFTHSQSTYRALIHKLCAFRRFDIVKELLQEMPNAIGSPPDEDIFITIVRGLGRARMVKRVIKVVDLVTQFGKKPSMRIFNSVLDVLVKEDIDLAREFYRKKMMGSGVEGDEYTFGILMKGLCLTNRIGDGFNCCKNGKVGRARSLMNEMEEPNDVTFNILISAYCKEENLVQALVLLEKCFNLGSVPDVVTGTKIRESESWASPFEGDGEEGCFPNVDTYNILISGCCEYEMLDLALDLFNEMKTDGINWNFVTYDTLIKGLCSGGRMEDGFKILEIMEESKEGPRGRLSPYDSVLYGLYKGNQLDEALTFLIQMEKLFPRAVDRSLRIVCLCEEGAIEDAKKVFGQILGEGGVPNVLVYDHLIHGFCEVGYMREAFELMNEMVGRGYYLLAPTFNALISGFCWQGKVSSALKLIDDMVVRGCNLDIGSYNLG
uniref:Pentatricopeptide repeat-containing protein n=1 Tax=Quercus lobata TaxID=97700 RepID=A0A7N2KKG5_QUELO